MKLIDIFKEKGIIVISFDDEKHIPLIYKFLNSLGYKKSDIFENKENIYINIYESNVGPGLQDFTYRITLRDITSNVVVITKIFSFPAYGHKTYYGGSSFLYSASNVIEIINDEIKLIKSRDFDLNCVFNICELKNMIRLEKLKNII